MCSPMPDWTPELDAFLDAVTEADLEVMSNVTFVPADMFEGLLMSKEDL